MAQLIPSRGSQNVQVAEFVCNWNDTMKDSSNLNASNPALSGVLKDMGAITTGDLFKAMNLPPNSEVIGGSLQIDVAGVGPTAYTVEIGHTTDGLVGTFVASLLGVTSLLSAVGTQAVLVLTAAAVNPGFQSATPNDVYIRLIRSVAVATAGKFVIRVMFVLRNKMNEASPS
jgi:hypothetical protein